MEQNHRPTLAAGNVVNSDTVYLDEPAQRPWSTGLNSVEGLHGFCGLPDSLAGLLNSFVPVLDSGSSALERGFQGLGGLLGQKA
jgi:hypothetical protein